MRRPVAQALLLLTLFVAACGSPPNKEMDQAQGAIDAARAAGADRYAATELEAANASLRLANEAVGQRDFRLALNPARESREQATTAARVAAETRARLRGEVERAMAEVAALMAQANGRLDAAEKVRPRLPRAVLTEAGRVLQQVNADVQKAGEAIEADDYMAAQEAVDGVREQIEGVLKSLDEASRTQPTRRRR